MPPPQPAVMPWKAISLANGQNGLPVGTSRKVAGGQGCELSKNLGYALVAAGKTRVLIYEGGMPEWLAMGYPVAKGATGEGA